MVEGESVFTKELSRVLRQVLCEQLVLDSNAELRKEGSSTGGRSNASGYQETVMVMPARGRQRWTSVNTQQQFVLTAFWGGLWLSVGRSTIISVSRIPRFRTERPQPENGAEGLP